MKRFLCRAASLCFTVLACAVVASATHMHGQEAFYRYIGNNTYQLTFRIYQDFNSGDVNAIREDDPMTLAVFSGLIKVDDVTVVSDGASQQILGAGPHGCVTGNTAFDTRVLQFTTNVSLPPAANGYRIKMQRCCLGTNLSNIRNPGQYGLEAEIIIPGNAASADAPKNSSPVFKPVSKIQECVNARFRMDFSASDGDGDSLVYRLAQPNGGGSASNAKPSINAPQSIPLGFNPGFSPAAPFGLKGAISLNPQTGQAEIFSGDQGNFLLTVACDEYRNGQYLSTVQRAIVIRISNCVYDLKAGVVRDSAAIYSGIPDLYITRCGGQKRVAFKNASIGATSYRWEFGDTTTNGDTSLETDPVYEYPGPGKYQVKLVAIGPNCRDSVSFAVWISSGIVTQDFAVSGGPCLGNDYQLTDLSLFTPPGGATYLWQTATTSASGSTTTIRFSASGSQWVRSVIITDSGCVSYMTKYVQVGALDVRIESDTVVVVGRKLRLIARGAEKYTWVSDSHILSGLDQPEVDIFFTSRVTRYPVIVLGETLDECRATDTAYITIADRGYYYVPDAFTPNGDGINDVLLPFLADYHFKDFSVYNRWGQRIFESKNLQSGWDGTFKGEPQQLATYYWMLRAQSPSGADAVFSGNVTLIR